MVYSLKSFCPLNLYLYRFIEKLELRNVCGPSRQTCQVESTGIKCGEVFQDPGFDFGRKKRQASTDTLNIKFNFTITIGFTECTEVNCQQKYDRLMQVYIYQYNNFSYFYAS